MQMNRAVQVLMVAGLVAAAGCKKEPPATLKSDSTAVDPTPSAAAVSHDSTATDTTPAAMAKKTVPPKKP